METAHPQVSVVILARNEAGRITPTLQAVSGWCHEILLIDNESEDETVEVAQRYGARILTAPRSLNFDAARNVGLDAATGDWIWVVDADEVPPVCLVGAVLRLLAERGSEFEALAVPFKNYFCGRWIRHCGWWPGFTRPQILKRGRCRYLPKLHQGVHVEGRTVHFMGAVDHPEYAIDHYSYDDVEHYFRKLNAYTSGEAESLLQEGGAHSWQAQLAAFVLDWRLYYDVNRAYGDGMHGFVLSFLSATYRFACRAKLWDLRRSRGELHRPEPVPASVAEMVRFMAVVLRDGPGEWLRPDHTPPSPGYQPLPADWLRSPLKYGVAPSLATPEQPLISAVVLARNEAARIGDALRSLSGWVDELFVVDHASTDETARIAAEMDARVLSAPASEEFDGLRSLALAHARGQWIFFLDADERTPPEFARTLRRLVEERGDEFEALYLPSRNIVCDKWLQCPAWWPGYSRPYLLKADTFTYRPELHAGVEVRGRSLHFPANDPEMAVRHESVRDITAYLEKLNHYTSLEAKAAVRSGVELDHGWQTQLHAFTRDWVIHYDQFRAHEDGMHGFVFAFLCSLYRFVTVAKHWDECRKLGREREEPLPQSLSEIMEFMVDHVDPVRPREPAPRQVQSQQAPNAPSDAAAASPSPVPLEPLIWHGPFFDRSGYADEARNFIFSLQELNEAVAIAPMVWGDDGGLSAPQLDALTSRLVEHHVPALLYVSQTTPPLNRPSPNAAYSIARTMFETDSLPPGWAELLNRMDRIWVPTPFNLATFSAAGVDPAKLAVVPGAVDGARFAEETEAWKLPGEHRFRFLSVFAWSRHKGWELLVDSFVREFGEESEVGLVIKTWGNHGYVPEEIEAQLDEFLRTRFGRPLAEFSNLHLWQERVPMDELPKVYRAADAFVLPSRGEGWGRPLMEAMAAGLPTIATAWSATTSFHDDAVGYPVPCSVVPVSPEGEREIPIYRGQRWAEPDAEALRAAMRRVVTHVDEAAQKGKAAQRRILAEYSRKAVGQRLREEIRHCQSEAVERLREREQRGAAAEPLRRPASNPVKLDPIAVVDFRRALGRPLRVRWEGDVSLRSSLAHVNRELLGKLLQCDDLELSIQESRSDWHRLTPTDEPSLAALAPSLGAELSGAPDVTIRHHFPPNWRRPEAGKLVVLQPWEMSHLPTQEWVEGARAADEVWVYTRWVRDIYVRSGVPAEKLRVVPLGVDPERFSPEGEAYQLPTRKRFRFLFVGGTIERKGADLLLEAYRQAFTREDDVCLVVKDMGTRTFYQHSHHAEAFRRAVLDTAGPEVVYTDAELSAAELAALYRACDCVVLPCRGEGFGLAPLEGMACGLPAIVTAGSAPDDYLDDGTALRVPYRRRLHPNLFSGAGAPVETPWELEPDLSALVDAFHWAYRRQEEMRERGRQGRARILAGWTWDRAASTVRSGLEYLLCPPPAPQIGYPLPWTSNGQENRSRPKSPKALRRKDGEPTVSVCLIARNEAGHIADCIRSIQPAADEVILVDTGSTDETPQIAHALGARVFQFPWCDDFAAARNAALSMARGDWIFWKDADDITPTQTCEGIRDLVRKHPARDAGFLVSVRIPAGDGEWGDTWVEHLKLFPNRPDLRFEHRIHEQIIPAIRRAGLEVLPAPLYVTHQNYDRSPAGQARKRSRDFRLLALDLRDRPEHPFVLFNWGMTHLKANQEYEVAAHFLERCLAQSDPRDSIVANAFFLLTACHKSLEAWREARMANERGRLHYPDDAELLFQAAEVYQQVGRFNQSRRALERLVGGTRIETLPSRSAFMAQGRKESVQSGLRTYRGWHALALLYARMGDDSHAVRVLHRIVTEYPEYSPAREDLERLRGTLPVQEAAESGRAPGGAEARVTSPKDGDGSPTVEKACAGRKEAGTTQEADGVARDRKARSISKAMWRLALPHGLGDLIFSLSVAWALHQSGQRVAIHTIPRHAEWVRFFNFLDEVTDAPLPKRRTSRTIDFSESFPHASNGDRTAALAELVGVAVTEWVPAPTLPKELRSWAQEMMRTHAGHRPGPRMVYVPFCNRRAETRSLPVPVAWATSTRLAELGPVLWVDENELPHPAPAGVTDLTGKLTLPQVWALLEASDLCVSMDSGLLHAAVTLRKPAVGVFTHIGPEQRLQLAERYVAVQPLLPCAPCGEADDAFSCLRGEAPLEAPLTCVRLHRADALLEAARFAVATPGRHLWQVTRDGRIISSQVLAVASLATSLPIVRQNGSPQEPDWQSAPQFGRRESILQALRLLHQVHPGRATLVETGTARNSDPEGMEGDSWSTLAWAWYANQVGGHAFSVDIEPENVLASRQITAGYATSVTYFTQDSVEFLAGWPESRGPIHLLYLDSMDYDPPYLAASEEHHLREAECALPHLAPRCVVVVDDCYATMIDGELADCGGKGRKAVPYLLSQGFRVRSGGGTHYSGGSQVVLVRD